MTASQDGCPLEDVVIDTESGQGEVSDVKVTFKLWRCLDQAELRESVNEVHFDVVTEDGRCVIDDIHRVSAEERDSVFAEMGQLASEAEWGRPPARRHALFFAAPLCFAGIGCMRSTIPHVRHGIVREKSGSFRPVVFPTGMLFALRRFNRKRIQRHGIARFLYAPAA